MITLQLTGIIGTHSPHMPMALQWLEQSPHCMPIGGESNGFIVEVSVFLVPSRLNAISCIFSPVCCQCWRALREKLIHRGRACSWTFLTDIPQRWLHGRRRGTVLLWSMETSTQGISFLRSALICQHISL